jgi:alpha-glucosidase
MHDVLRFWLDRGVDGFRLDAIAKIAKDPLLRDHAGAPRRHDEDWETIHDRLRGIRRVVDEYYQGEELGLPDADIPPDRVVDVDGRDTQRAPIPWAPPSQAGPAAGFSTAEPWLPPAAAAEELNVERQAADRRSTLWLVRRLAALRAATPALQTGSQRSLEAGAGVLAWLRERDGDRLLALVNFDGAPAPIALPAELGPAATLLLATDAGRAEGEVALGDLTLGPSEAVLLRLP